ncbi:MAG TPA: TnsA endonuclease N-terminal domain-containing protein [Candidatus Saccharimonadales bacterium]|jgi:hypothetical protein
MRKGSHMSLESKRKISKTMQKICADPDVRKRLRNISSHIWDDPIKKAAMAAKVAKTRIGVCIPHKDATKKKISITMKQQFASGIRKPSHGGGYSTKYKQWISTTKGGRMFCDSSWELAFIELLESSSLVKKFIREPFAIPYKYKGIKHSFFPDYLVEYKDGRKFLVEVKSKCEPRRKVMTKFKVAYDYCTKYGYEWITIREKPILSLGEYLQ